MRLAVLVEGRLCIQIPESDRCIATARREQSSVGTELETGDGFEMAFDGGRASFDGYHLKSCFGHADDGERLLEHLLLLLIFEVLLERFFDFDLVDVERVGHGLVVTGRALLLMCLSKAIGHAVQLTKVHNQRNLHRTTEQRSIFQLKLTENRTIRRGHDDQVMYVYL